MDDDGDADRIANLIVIRVSENGHVVDLCTKVVWRSEA